MGERVIEHRITTGDLPAGQWILHPGIGGYRSVVESLVAKPVDQEAFAQGVEAGFVRTRHEWRRRPA